MNRNKQDIIDTVKDGEPIDFATISFDDKKLRETYRKAESFALEMIANRGCMFCFDKADENGMGGLGELERIGYGHTSCIEAFYEQGFFFKLHSSPNSDLGYYWEITTENPYEVS